MYGRQFATMTVMVLLSFLMLGASFATLSYQYTIQEKRDAMSRSANIIASYTSSYINANGEYSWQEKDFQAQLNVLALVTDPHAMISTAQGVVVYATDGVNELMELESRSVPDQIVSSVVEGSFAGATNLGGMYERPRYLVGLPITTGNFLQGLVLVSCEASEISGMWQDLSAIFLVTAGAVVLIAAIISSVTSLHQSQPIKEIAAAARQFGHGELDVRVNVGKRKDEVGELAEAFNFMANSLERAAPQRVRGQCLPRTQDPYDHHRRLCRRNSGRHDSAREGKGVSQDYLIGDPAAIPAGAVYAGSVPAPVRRAAGPAAV